MCFGRALESDGLSLFSTDCDLFMPFDSLFGSFFTLFIFALAATKDFRCSAELSKEGHFNQNNFIFACKFNTVNLYINEGRWYFLYTEYEEDTYKGELEFHQCLPLMFINNGASFLIG